MIRVSVQLKFEEYLKESFRILFRRFKLFFFMMGLVFFVGIILSAVNTIQSNWQVVVFPLAFVSILMFLTYFEAKLAWTKKPNLGESTEYLLSDDGVSLQSPSLSMQHKWSNFFKLEETRHSLLLFLDQNHLMIFPKSNFLNPTELINFKEFVLTHLTIEKQQVIKTNRKKIILVIVGLWALIIVFVFFYSSLLHK